MAGQTRCAHCCFRMRTASTGRSTGAVSRCAKADHGRNPRWCELRRVEAAVLRVDRAHDPQNLLRAAIFFDFRPVYG
jgi:signal-transduction protein with cAMP-binding, CBS, and nucleotidyltransferase domain